MSETNRIEFKREFNIDVDIEKEIIAFLNYNEGGIIYIGIDKTAKVIGVLDADGDALRIKDRIKNNISPSAMGLFDVIIEEREGKNIIKIIVVGGGEKPYFKKKFGMTEKGSFIRIGTASESMPQKMIDQLFATRTRNSIGKIRSYRQDLTFEQLRIYYDEKRTPLKGQFKKSLELLTDDGDLNYAAYLLADDNAVSIKVAKYSGVNRVDLIENNEYGYCSLIKATKSVLDKIELENLTTTQITAKERIDHRLWNPVALREAIINGIIHNDFTREIPPKFEIFADRIEITSAGILPEGLSEEEFFDGVSFPRNRELMRVYRDLELVEQLGSGVPRILESYDKECFKFLDNFTRISFPISKASGRYVRLVDGLVGGLVDGLVESQQEIIRLIMANPRISKKSMSKHIGISTTAIDKHIRSLRENKVIGRVGSDRSGYWELLN
ncbi:RNA-binding domain-containing protein [Sphingobacterium faecale]|uniref:DNA binding domain-containing protein n=1 Tax=Sphingobacterium faecale TaxID=2803775 RepID=A0ABS1RA47_9SPHI|nr:RNA-binding domain-containing protein [Sphingobacterium faecale]MBL1411572.1 putative DNA binding domain-containing protein [Sphingobacterium faecale]